MQRVEKTSARELESLFQSHAVVEAECHRNYLPRKFHLAVCTTPDVLVVKIGENEPWPTQVADIHQAEYVYRKEMHYTQVIPGDWILRFLSGDGTTPLPNTILSGGIATEALPLIFDIPSLGDLLQQGVGYGVRRAPCFRVIKLLEGQEVVLPSGDGWIVCKSGDRLGRAYDPTTGSVGKDFIPISPREWEDHYFLTDVVGCTGPGEAMVLFGQELGRLQYLTDKGGLRSDPETYLGYLQKRRKNLLEKILDKARALLEDQSR